MAIQIDRSLLLPKIEKRTKNKKFYSSHQKETVSLSDETITICQQWIDDKVYSGKDISTRSDCRREMYVYALDNIDLRSKDKSYFIPTFIWIWLAQKLIYGDFRKQMPLSVPLHHPRQERYRLTVHARA